MSHFRDRVITSQNVPQLPSGRRADASIPVLVQSASFVAVNRTPLTVNAPSVDLGTVVPTQTAGVTSP